MSNEYLKTAFHAVCKEAKPAVAHYVVLMESVSYYGGPEEGGWWGKDEIVESYQIYATEEEAETAAEAVKVLAADLTAQAKTEYGRTCLRESRWLEARGLDDSFLPEPDGPSTFRVVVRPEIPQNIYGTRHYE
jgi:hypothetical protein